MYLQTDEFGTCLTEGQAQRYLERNSLQWVDKRGALVFQYPGQEAREILPIFINGKGWFFPKAELERDYVKPAPEVIPD